MKKLLALVLALVMVLGLATVGASAATADFKDQEKIQHQQAVNTLVSLGVLAGRTDGNFDPSGLVKRSEMAKMISIILLGDVSVSAFEGTQTDLTDINGHWAEGYIKYCYSQGIIAGRGNGTFDPEAPVTTTEAAKMCLTAIGYNSDVQGYTGEKWKINVTSDAQMSGFFAEIGGLTADHQLTRDETAQMILNAADADRIIKTPTLNTATGTIQYEYKPDETNHTDLLNKTFKAYTYEGYLTKFDYNTTDKEWTYSIEDRAIVDNAVAGGAATAVAIPMLGLNQHTPGSVLGTNTGTAGSGPFDFTGKEDFSDMYGMRVKILYTQKSDDTNIDKVLGMYTTKTKVVTTKLLDDLPAAATTATLKEIDIDGKISLTNECRKTPVYLFANGAQINNNTEDIARLSNTSAAVWAAAAAKTTIAGVDAYQISTLKAIDVTGDNKADLVIVYPQFVGEVSYVSSTQFTVKKVEARTANFGGIDGSFKYADVTAPDGLKKDDYVLYTPAEFSATATDTFEKLEVKTAKVDAVKKSDDKAQIGGTWYNTGRLPTVDVPEAGDEVEYALVGTYLVYIDGANKNGAGDLGLVTGAAPATSGVDNLQEIKILKSDGSTVTAKVKKLNGVDQKGLATVEVGNFFDWKLNSDGEFELTAVTADFYRTSGVNSANLPANAVRSDFDRVNTETLNGTVYGAAAKWDFGATPAAAPVAGAARTTSDAAGAHVNNLSTGSTTFTAAGAKTDATIEDFTVIADDAVVWVFDTKGDGINGANGDDQFITTGKALKADDSGATVVLWAAGITNNKTNYTEVKAAYVFTTGLSAESNYGFVLDDPIKTTDGTKEYVTVKFWDGSKVQELRTKSDTKNAGENNKAGTGAYSLGKRNIFTYEIDSNGYLKDVENLVKTKGITDVAVTKYSGTNIQFSYDVYYTNNGIVRIHDTGLTALSYTITKDTKIFYVDSDALEGQTSGSIGTANATTITGATDDGAAVPADATAGTYWLSNAYYYDEDNDGELELLVVDINANMKNVE